MSIKSSSGAFALVLLTTLAHAAPAPAPKAEWRGLRARDSEGAARPLARAWQSDAALVWLEASDSLFADGTAAAWTTVWWSARGRVSRQWTVRRTGAEAHDLNFPLDLPALEDGWIDATQAIAKSGRSGTPREAFLCNGPVAARTTWTLTFGDRAWTADALRGALLDERATAQANPQAPSDEALPPWLGAHQAFVLARASLLRDDKGGKERERWLAPREASALARLSATDAALDTLGRGALAAADREADQSLDALARWRAASAQDDSLLARARARIDAARSDLAGARPTELAVYMTLEGRARPARVTLSIDGAPAAVATYGELEWRALDSGAWAEVARRTARSGPREVRVDLEDANRRTQAVTWRGTLDTGRLAVLRLRVPAAGSPALDFVAATAP